VNSEALFVPKDSPARSVADLKGKRVAFQKGSGSHFLLASALQKAGLKFSDITPVYLSPSDARAAFVSGGIDAWVVWDPYFASAQKAYQVRVLSDYSGLPQANGFYLASRNCGAIAATGVGAAGAGEADGQMGKRASKEVSTLLTQQTGVPADIVATWMQRSASAPRR
jgi:sulfonate transport system substrate-binding protein